MRRRRIADSAEQAALSRQIKQNRGEVGMEFAGDNFFVGDTVEYRGIRYTICELYADNTAAILNNNWLLIPEVPLSQLRIRESAGS